MGRPRRPLDPATRRLLDQTFDAQLQLEDARRRRDQLAIQAAQAGATWREVGAAAGMSAQAAHERYRHQLPDR